MLDINDEMRMESYYIIYGTVDVVLSWKYGGIHYRKTNILNRLIFGI